MTRVYKIGVWIVSCLLCVGLMAACSTDTDNIKAKKETKFKVELSVDRSKGERWIWSNALKNPDVELQSIEYAQKVSAAKDTSGVETFTFMAHETGTYTLEFACAGELPRTHTTIATISE